MLQERVSSARRTDSKFRIAGLMCSAFMLAATAIHAQERAQERYAVLVGVGEYVNLDAKLHLKGPPNDVRLAREYLLNVEEFDEGNIYWLADDAPLDPTRANILAALEEVDRNVQAGDFVLLHLSGHGSRQPAAAGDPDEHDGYDEIFLPADVADWDDYIGSVRNAITDNELGQFISSYRSKGSDVWLIVDSCHAGTMTRGLGDDEVVERFLDPVSALGLPESYGGGDGTASQAAGPTLVDKYQSEEQGMLVAFSAAHTSERAPEMPLSSGNDDPQVRGLLSHNIFTSLGKFPGVSYRQLAQLITSQYASLPWTRSTPQFYGTDMDRVVFNGSEERATLFAAVRAKEGNVLEVDAGALRGFDIGANVAIHSDARDIDDNVIGIGTVVSATATESDVEPQWAENVDAPAPGRAVYARLTVPAYTSEVMISLVDTREEADNQRLRAIAADIAPKVPLVEFADYSPGADYFAAFFEKRFWLLLQGQSLPCEVREEVLSGDAFDCITMRDAESLFWAPADEAEELVRKAARVRTLTKLEGLTGSGRLTIGVEIQRPGMDEPVPRIDSTGALYPGDIVYYSVQNATNKPWDVFFFYVASNLQIEALQAPGQSARILRGESTREYLGEIESSTTGTESLVIIADPVARIGDGVEADYSFLEQRAYVRSVMKGGMEGEVSPVQGALESLWETGDYTFRGIGTGPNEATIRVFTWTVETQPR